MEHCIGKTEFEKLVSVYTEYTGNNDTLSFEDIVIMIRLYNTITHDTLLNKSDGNYAGFTKVFMLQFAEVAAKRIEAYPTKGMAYYSKKYDLYIGGPPHANSQYYITDK